MVAITPIFKLKDQQSEEPTLIYLNLYYNKIRFVYSTAEKIRPIHWNKATQRPYLKNSEKGLSVIMDRQEISLAGTIKNKLDRIQAETERISTYCSFQCIPLTNDILKTELNKVFKPEAPKKKQKQPEVLTLNAYIENFISDIKTGKRTTPEKGTRYTQGTIKNYLGFQSLFNAFQNDLHRKLNFEQITMDIYDKYVAFFNKKNYSPNTIGRHIKALKVIMRSAAEEGLHHNLEFERKSFKVITTSVDHVYLTQKEVEDLYNLDLSENKTLDIARDIFLIGCYTAQRYSDYGRISSQHIKIINGKKVIDLIQKKTRERVIIPVRPELEAILKKYDYNPPHTHEQKINDRIKIVCEKAKIKELIEIEEIKGGLRVTKREAKHQLIKTHTARRTGATLMFLANVPTISIMKITGHKTEREFMKYIRITKQENAENLMNHPYFLGKPLNLVKS